MSNPWFRMYSEFATDPKVQMLSESDQRRFVMLLCLRCCNGDVTLHDDEVAFQLRINQDEWLATKHVLLAKGLINEDSKPAAWDMRQFQSDSSNRPPAHVWRTIRERIFVRDDYTCTYCGSRGVKLECDHVIPVSRGGHHEDNNLVTACFKCNRSKRSKTLNEWKISSREDH